MASTAHVTGHISTNGAGSIGQGLAGPSVLGAARMVQVVALGNDGQETTVATAPVSLDGTFDADLPANASPTQIFIIKVLDIGGAVIGAGVVNGLPAFLKGFLLDAPIDTVTSFKAQVITTIAKGGVPGVQNYLNVLDAYVDAQLANTIATESVAATDLDSLVSAVANAVVAAENVIVSALQSAGIPVDDIALAKAQAAVVSGIEGLVTSSSNTFISSSNNLVASLEAASAKAAAPLDKAIFDAIVNGGAAFKAKFKKSAPSKMTSAVDFSASKTVAVLEADLATAEILTIFQGADPKVVAALTNACATFKAQIANAKTPADLAAAKTAFAKALLSTGGGANGVLGLLVTVVTDVVALASNVEATLGPLAQTLAQALTQPNPDPKQIAAALAKFEADIGQVAALLEKALPASDAKALADALAAVEKVVAP